MDFGVILTHLVAVFTQNSNKEGLIVGRHGRHLHFVIQILPQLNPSKVYFSFYFMDNIFTIFHKFSPYFKETLHFTPLNFKKILIII
jgi:hypothetical protein